MINGAGKNRITKDSVLPVQSTIDPAFLKAISPIPRIFRFVNLSTLYYSNEEELRQQDVAEIVQAMIQINRQGEGAFVRKTAQSYPTIVKLEGEFVVWRDFYSPPPGTTPPETSISCAPVQFSVKARPSGNRSATPSDQMVAGFYPECNYLIIGGVKERPNNNSISIAGEYVPMIRKIFKHIKKMGYKPITTTKKNKKLMIGSDPEFSLMKDGELVSATKFFGDSDNTVGKVGCDGHADTGELRPLPAEDPIFFVRRHIKPLIRYIARKVPSDIKVTTGGGFRNPLGDHIHFNKRLSAEEIKLLDDFVGNPSNLMPGGDRAGGSYGHLGEVRNNSHGCEYRTCPSGLIPDLMASRYVAAWCIIKKWEKMRIGEEFEYEFNLNGIPTKEAYLELAPRKKYKKYLESFHKIVTTGEIKKDEDFLAFWFPRRKAKAPKYRAILSNPMPWAPHLKKISVKDLSENIEVKVEPYSRSEFDTEDQDTEIKESSTIFLSVPYSFAEKVKEDSELQEQFQELCDGMGFDMALRSISTSVEIRYPATWKKKRESITPSFVKRVVRLILREGK